MVKRIFPFGNGVHAREKHRGVMADVDPRSSGKVILADTGFGLKQREG